MECREGYCLNGGKCSTKEGRLYCNCGSKYTGKKCEISRQCPAGKVFCTKTLTCQPKNRMCSLNESGTCFKDGNDEFIYTCGSCNKYCKNGGSCYYKNGKYRTCLCPPEYNGKQCEINANINCPAGQIPCTGQGANCAVKRRVCSQQVNCSNINEERRSAICGECYTGRCFDHGSCSLGENKTASCACRAGWVGDRCDTKTNTTCQRERYICKVGSWPCVDKVPICQPMDCALNPSEITSVCQQVLPSAQAQTGHKSTYIVVGVVIAIVALVAVLVVAAYIINKRRKKKLSLFSVFYDPRKKDLKQEPASGVGNPTYDAYDNEEFKMSEPVKSVFVMEEFPGMSEKSGVTAMANPLYQDPYLEKEFLPMS